MGTALRDIFGRRAPRNTEPRDARFMEEALRRWGDTVYRVALGQTGSPSDAEDVCQDVFVRLLRDRTVFTSEEHLKAWLIRVALNRCHDLARSRWNRRIPWDDQQAEEALHASPTVTPAEESVRDLIALLPEDQRATVTLYYAEGYSATEIGRILGCSAGAVRTRLSRIRETLRRQLEDRLDDPRDPASTDDLERRSHD